MNPCFVVGGEVDKSVKVTEECAASVIIIKTPHVRHLCFKEIVMSRLKKSFPRFAVQTNFKYPFNWKG